jgi:hypothetical protein
VLSRVGLQYLTQVVLPLKKIKKTQVVDPDILSVSWWVDSHKRVPKVLRGGFNPR